MTLLSLISAHGGKLVRQNRHKVFRFPDGRTFTIASTPSDHRAELNQIAELKRFLGLTKNETTVGERRERKPKRARTRQSIRVEPAPLRKTFTDDLKTLASTYLTHMFIFLCVFAIFLLSANRAYAKSGIGPRPVRFTSPDAALTTNHLPSKGEIWLQTSLSMNESTSLFSYNCQEYPRTDNANNCEHNVNHIKPIVRWPVIGLLLVLGLWFIERAVSAYIYASASRGRMTALFSVGVICVLISVSMFYTWILGFRGWLHL